MGPWPIIGGVCLSVYLCVCLCICSVSPPTVFMVGQPFFVCKTCIPRSSSGDKLECKIYYILKVDIAGGSLRSHWSIQSLQQLSQVASPGLLAALWEAIGPSNHCSSCHRWPVMYCIIEQPIGINNTCSLCVCHGTEWCNVFDKGLASLIRYVVHWCVINIGSCKWWSRCLFGFVPM